MRVVMWTGYAGPEWVWPKAVYWSSRRTNTWPVARASWDCGRISNVASKPTRLVCWCLPKPPYGGADFKAPLFGWGSLQSFPWIPQELSLNDSLQNEDMQRSRKMNACIIAYTFYEIDFRVRRYAETLVSAGYHVDVFALKRKADRSKAILNGVNIHHLQEREYDETGLKSYLFRMVAFCIRVFIEILKKQFHYRYDVVHLHNPPDFLIFSALLPKLVGAKIIFDMHENLPELYCAKFNRTPDAFIVKIVMLFEKLATQFADFTIVAHDLLRKRVVKRDRIQEQKCVALLNYPSKAFFKPVAKVKTNNAFHLIYPGTISYQHGIDIAINAMGIVKQHNSSIKLDIYGKLNEPNYYELLRKLINDLDLHEIVTFHEVVPLEAMQNILARASIGIVPKRGGIFGSEAFSTKILELMMAGMPVIVSKTKIDEYYFDSSTVMFFEEENHVDLANCILELYRHTDKRESLSERGIEFTELYNWEVKSKEYLSIVDQLVVKQH
jgi:glycosyltransferase involved in cell wall biosynthesis